VSFHPKPAAAGVRILHLGGGIQDAQELATILKKLRSKLFGPVHHYFDIVFCSGVGIFFAVMMLCQGACIEDCIHHLKRLTKVKVRKNTFSFSSHLKFSFSDLLRSPVKLILCFKNLVVPSYRAEGIATSSTFEELVQEEHQRFWPASKIDTIVDLPRSIGDEKALSCTSDLLIASSLFVELDKAPEFYDDSPVTVELVVRCRLPQGTALTHLTNLYFRKRRIWYRVNQEEFSSDLVCPRATWVELKESGVFLRRVQVQIDSDSAIIDVQIEGVHGWTSRSISNCPCDIGQLVGLSSSARELHIEKSQFDKTIASIELLQTELSNF
jgi:hypothetical protein